MPVATNQRPNVAQLLRLQRTVGNQAVNRLLAPKVQTKPAQTAEPTVPQRPNETGLPDALKGGLEQLSGLDLSAVRVHYDSPEPAQVEAHAYTQGADIHVGPGQEQHLAHEGWHVVQQMRGQVRPTLQAKAWAVNVDDALEDEADIMGTQATDLATTLGRLPQPAQAAASGQLLGQAPALAQRSIAGLPVRQFKCGGKGKNKNKAPVQGLDLHDSHDHHEEESSEDVKPLVGTFPIDFVVVTKNAKVDELPDHLNPNTLVKQANAVLSEGGNKNFDIQLAVGRVDVVDDFVDMENDEMFQKIPMQYRGDSLVKRNYVMKQAAEKALEIAGQYKDRSTKASVVFAWNMGAKEGDDVSGFTVRGVGDRPGDIATSGGQGAVIEEAIKANLQKAGYGGMVHLFGNSPSANMDKLGETLAHEFGHVLDLKHEHGKENLMHATVGERGHGISNKQVGTMNQHLGVMEDTLGGPVRE